ncbi:MAG: YceI family protein [Acidobacteria bacterium]|nr:YceI family protein [Acidobacteriota bacterium]MBI3471834.1 YceI family protein [Candidatus Solibacter usitatus]
MTIPARALTALVAAAVAASAADYRIEPAEGSRFTLSVEKTGLYKGKKHLLVYERYSGLLRYDPATPAASQVRFAVEAASAALRDDWGSGPNHKKILAYAFGNMMDAERHPRITFTSSRVEPGGEQQFRVTGTLEIRGIAKPCEVAVHLDTLDDGALVLEGRAAIRMTDYGLKPPTAALGAIGTKDLMEVSFKLRAAKPQ